MAYPIDPKQGFMRTPDRYPHDAFGVDTGGRVRPHSGFDSTPRVPNAEARSVLGGTVVKADWTKYAGNYVVEAAPDGWLWLTLHLASRSVRAGAVTEPGSVIGVVGNTGGGGALGSKATIGIHSHVSRCRDMAAVNRIVNGLVRPRYKGETNAEWAEAHGLSDPYPHIIESLKARDALEDFMAPIDEARFAALETNVNMLLTELRNVRPTIDALRSEQVEEDGIAQSTHKQAASAAADAAALREAILGKGNGYYSWLDRIRSVMNELEKKLLKE